MSQGLSPGTQSLIGAGLSFLGGERANEANAKQARKNRMFQERMIKEKYQIAVNDLDKAGLNKMLAYGNIGSTSPAGAQAQMQDTMTGAVQTGLQTRRLKEDLKAIGQDISTKKAAEANQYAQEKFQIANAKAVGEAAQRTRLENKVLEAQLPTIQRQEKWNRKLMDHDNVQKRLLPYLNSATGAAGIYKLFKNQKKMPKGFEIMNPKTGETLGRKLP